jgi:hydrogenase-4 component E
VPASLIAAAALIVLAYLATGPVTALSPGPASRLAPIGVATVLIGFFMLATRRKAVSQITGLLLVDNGAALATFLLSAGVPLLVEFGASLDVLLVAVVLRVLATTMRPRFGPVDLDQLRELHD